MKDFEFTPIYMATMNEAICALLGEKGFRRTKLISSGGFGMVFSALNTKAKKIALKVSFCEHKRQ
jgi:hypothetical protein